MKERAVTSWCDGCKADKPLASFYLKRGKPLKYCIPCTRKYRKQYDAYARVADGMRDDWDWAQALSKSLKVRAQHRDEPVDELVDGELLRCIYEKQEGLCALSGLQMLYPQIGPTNVGVEKWRSTLPPYQLGISIDVVRADKDKEWAAGNIFLCCYMFAQVYLYAGNVQRFKEICSAPAVIPVIIHDRGTLAQLRDQRRADRIAAYKSKQEIPW